MVERGSLVVELGGAVGGGEVSCVDVAGARLAAGGGRALRVWVWAAGAGWAAAGAVPRAHRYCVTCTRWAPAGALLGSGGVDGVVRLWGCGAEGLEERAVLAAAGACGVRALCWAGARLLAGHDDGAVTVWLWARGELAAVLRAHSGSLHALAAAADGALLLTACTEGVLKLHDLEEVCTAGEVGVSESASGVAPLVWEDGAHDLGALCAAGTARGWLLATGGQDGRVRLWRVARGSDAGKGRLFDAGQLDGHSGAVTGLTWGGARSADGAWLLASCSLDRTARLWAVPEGAGCGEPSCVLLLHAHARYLTCVALDSDLRFLVTGSNDKSVRTWSLGALTLDAALRPPCAPLQHFALGDLEGIGPVAEVAAPEETGSAAAAAAAWCGQPHAGAVNCLASRGNLLASVSSDCTVRVFCWEEVEAEGEGAGSSSGELVELAALAAHTDAVAAVSWSTAGEPLLLSVAFDGHAVLWDIESGTAVRSLRLGAGGGGGTARGAALAGRLLLLAADELGAPLWDLDDDSLEPAHVFECGGSARCVSWAPGGRLAALGGGGGGGAGELRLLAAPLPAPATLYHDPAAHELEIESVAWSSVTGSYERLTLATAGAEGLVKLWLVHSTEEDEVQVQLARSLVAHGGGVRALAWGGEGDALLASGGGDSWARVWAPKETAPRAALPAPAPGGVTALAFLQHGSSWLVSLGGLDGSVGVWRLGAVAAAGSAGGSVEGEEEVEDGADARCWGGAGVQRWLREYVTSPPGAGTAGERKEALAMAASAEGLTGARLLDDPLEDIMELFGFVGKTTSNNEEEAVDSGDNEESKGQSEGNGEREEAALRSRLLDELLWLRREPPDHETEAAAPHALQCPVRHAAWREPARAADGVTYDRAALQEHWRAAGAVCVLDGARLAHRRVAPNYRARAALRTWLRAQHDASLPAPPATDACHPRCYFCATRADA